MSDNQRIRQLKERLKKISEIDPKLEFTRKQMEQRRRKFEQDINRFDQKKAESQLKNIQQSKQVLQSVTVKQKKEAQKVPPSPKPPKLQAQNVVVKQQPIKQQLIFKTTNSLEKAKRTVTSFTRSNGIFSQSTEIRKELNLNRAFTQPQVSSIQQKENSLEKNKNAQKKMEKIENFKPLVFKNSSSSQVKNALVQDHSFEKINKNNTPSEYPKANTFQNNPSKQDFISKSDKEKMPQANTLETAPKMSQLEFKQYSQNIFNKQAKTSSNLFAQSVNNIPAKQLAQPQSNLELSKQENNSKREPPLKAVTQKAQVPIDSQPWNSREIRKNQEQKQTPQKQKNQATKNPLLQDTPFPKQHSLAANTLKSSENANPNIFANSKPKMNIFSNHQQPKKIFQQNQALGQEKIFKKAVPPENLFSNNSSSIFRQAEKQSLPTNKSQQEQHPNPQNNSLAKTANLGVSKQSTSTNPGNMIPNNIFAGQKPQNIRVNQPSNNRNIFKQTKTGESINLFKQNDNKSTNIFKQPNQQPNIFTHKSQTSIFQQPKLPSNQNKPYLQTVNNSKWQVQQDSESQLEESQQGLVDVDVSDPQKSHMHHEYDKSQILFKEIATKFKIEGKLYQKQFISVEKLPNKEQLYVFVKSKTFQVIYCGRIIKQTEVLPIKGVYFNIQVKCLLDCRPETAKNHKASFQSIKVQFKTEEVGKKFATMISDFFKQ